MGETTLWLASAGLSHDFGWATATSQAAYSRFEGDFAYEPQGIGGLPNPRNTRSRIVSPPGNCTAARLEYLNYARSRRGPPEAIRKMGT